MDTYLTDELTIKHSLRTADITKEFCEYLKIKEDEAIKLYLAAKYHDIGKNLISEDIINKKEKLTDEEFLEIKKHPLLSFLILLTNKDVCGDSLIYILEHHERIDGLGYPYQKKGNEISFGGRLLAICDSYEAMTGHRKYREPLSKEEAIKEIEKNLGSQFDNDLGRKFISFIKENRSY